MSDQCTGPFSDARDCPVHRPPPAETPAAAYARGRAEVEQDLREAIHREQQTAANAMAKLAREYARGRADGRQEVLAKVRLLPSPWNGVTAGANPQKDGTMTPPLWHMECRWCGVRLSGQATVPGWRQPLHPANGCLFAEAHAVTPTEEK